MRTKVTQYSILVCLLNSGYGAKSLLTIILVEGFSIGSMEVKHR